MNFENKYVFSVTAINNYIKEIIENDNKLKVVYIKGEVSNAKIYSNGNMYFTLKDENSAISAVIFSNYLNKIASLPKDGDEIIVVGSLTVYGGRGTYQVRVYELYFDGSGQLYIELEKLKKKLMAEGLFDSSRKKELNLFPKNIGIVTSYPSAACEDLIKNIYNRYPLVNVYVFPTLVQGNNASSEIIKALDVAYTYPLDTLIIARGGGSIEDLWCFNDEMLIRKLATSPIPTISAIGHEIDFTLCDFVCDKRASTPTGAAVMATINKDDILLKLDDYSRILQNNLNNKITRLKHELEVIKVNPFFKNQLGYIDLKRQELQHIKEKLKVLSPLNILSRGYSVTLDENGNVIKSLDDIKEGQVMKTMLNNGTIKSQVIAKEKNNGREK